LDFDGAFAQLEDARRALEGNRSFNMGGDKLRIAQTMAGLQVVGQRAGRDGFWSAFLSNYDWAEEWLRNHGVNEPQALWLEVR
jgi:hypothetical protein